MMTIRRFVISPSVLLAACFLLVNSPAMVSCFQSRNVARTSAEFQYATFVASSSHRRKSYAGPTLHQCSGVEDNFMVIDVDETSSGRRRWLSRRALSRAIRVDRKEVAELGMSFMLTYNLVSNVNGSIFLSLAWYISSIRTGMSPLAAGQWKGLIGTYAGLYVFITLFRPLRLALAVALTKKVALVLEQTQDRFNCGKLMAAGMVLSAMLSFWLIFATCGIALASALAGVPIWEGI